MNNEERNKGRDECVAKVQMAMAISPDLRSAMQRHGIGAEELLAIANCEVQAQNLANTLAALNTLKDLPREVDLTPIEEAIETFNDVALGYAGGADTSELAVLLGRAFDSLPEEMQFIQ